MGDEKFYTVRGYQLLERQNNVLTPSLEDYLEMICRSIRKSGYIRVHELAAELNVKPSSVSRMLTKLAELKFIDYEKYGVIRLTDRGETAGSYLLWRHDVTRRLFGLLDQAHSEDVFAEAEMAEHILSRHTVEAIERLLLFFSENPDIYQKYTDYCTVGQSGYESHTKPPAEEN